jgi:hypothetical protein
LEEEINYSNIIDEISKNEKEKEIFNTDRKENEKINFILKN